MHVQLVALNYVGKPREFRTAAKNTRFAEGIKVGLAETSISIRFVQWGQEFPRVHTEPVCDLKNYIHRDLSFSSFHESDHRAMNSGAFRDLFLCQVALVSESAEVRRHGFLR